MGVIANGIAIMSHRSPDDAPPHSTDWGSPLGYRLHGGGERPMYSEIRLKRLLSSHGTNLHRLLGQAFKMIQHGGGPINWFDVVNLIFGDKETSEKARNAIADSYYQAERRHQQG